MKALVIVDLQNDFLPDGALPVPNGQEVIPVINALQADYDIIVCTQDWHPCNHESFYTNHAGKNAFEQITLHGLQQTLWPPHCIQDTDGAALSHALVTKKVNAIIRKGYHQTVDSYSAFFDNGHQNTTGLAGYLKAFQVTGIDVCGLAADYCVAYTAIDALALGLESRIIESATKPINATNYAKMKQIFLAKGGQCI